jgi:hypothetical protein
MTLTKASRGGKNLFPFFPPEGSPMHHKSRHGRSAILVFAVIRSDVINGSTSEQNSLQVKEGRTNAVNNGMESNCEANVERKSCRGNDNGGLRGP